MGLSEISCISKNEEQSIQDQIYSSIDNFENILFNAGAGSGKTFSLTESLMYIIRNHGQRLRQNNQKVMCITYTNVATNEIKERLGNSDLIEVSTIHSRLWTLIQKYNKELLKIHVKKIEIEIEKLNFDILENEEEKLEKQYRFYRELPNKMKKVFLDKAISSRKKFYKFYDKSAKIFKSAFIAEFEDFEPALKNVSHFKKVISSLFKIENFRACLKQIEAKNPKYTRVKYDEKFNNDILHRMIISHDTLLEYALSMVKSYDLLKRVVFDSYPYILIDEFQDTNQKVIEIMQLIDTKAKAIGRKIFIGYFGDSEQNIYTEGVGHDLPLIHGNLKKINKRFNRRSFSEIITVINKIRKDEIEQKSIFEDSLGGSVEFFSGGREKRLEFLEACKEDWQISSSNKLHCLVLLNKSVAELNGFPEVFKKFSDTAFYKKNFDRINTEILSNEFSKLGNVPQLFFNILEFIQGISNPNTFLSSIFDKKVYSRMTFQELKRTISILLEIKEETLGGYLKTLFEISSRPGNKSLKRIVRILVNLEKVSYQSLIIYLLDELFLNVGSVRKEEFKLRLKELFEEEIFIENSKSDLRESFENLISNISFSRDSKNEIEDFQTKVHELLTSENNDQKRNISNFLAPKIDSIFDEEIYSQIDVDEFESAKEKLSNLLNITLEEWFLWFRFVTDQQDSDIVYHTYHGTKGAEFENVAIIMENDFGRLNKNKFSNFFLNHENFEELNDEDKAKIINTKNLLYVSCSRAVKNLRILYLDSVESFKTGIETIFGEIKFYE